MTLSAKKGRGSGDSGSRVAASQPLVPQPLVQFTVWQGRPQHSVVPQSLRGRKTKKMVLKLLRHARQAAQPQHRLTRRFAAQRAATPRRALVAAASVQ